VTSRSSIAPARRRQRQQVLRRRLGRRVEDVAEARHRHLHLLKVLPELRQAQDRLHDLARDHIEGDEFADRHLAVDHRLRAEEQDQSAVVALLTYWMRFWPERAEHAGVERGAT
jgi:hypothetical protein